jgi:2,3-bisphosphoglycerate-independent phosphoglycerate mutase
MKKIILVVLDGFGIDENVNTNPIFIADPKNINSLLKEYPNTKLSASGVDVGLTKGDVGNSEVGHINLGAGKIVLQDFPRINNSISDRSFFKNPALIKTAGHIKNSKGNLHLIGLVGNGIVHSSNKHLYALLNFCKENSIKNVFLHLITDGRDSPPKSSMQTVKEIENKITELQIGKIATIMGRYYAMDRDYKWDRTEKAYLCLTEGQGNKAKSVLQAVESSYNQNITDEFIIPTNIVSDSTTVSLINNNDSIVFFNFRIDRVRQLTKAFVLDDFEGQANEKLSFKNENIRIPFKRNKKLNNLCFTTMTEYEKELSTNVMFYPIRLETTLGKIISDNKLSQLRITESEKERFVTFYFNGQNEDPYSNETRIIIPSPSIDTYDKKPEMSAYELTERLFGELDKTEYDFVLLNFANADMVGHTGNMNACIKAIKTLDECIKKIVDYSFNKKYCLLITADHGNIEKCQNPETNDPSTEHTSSLVPFILVDKECQTKKTQLNNGILADVAPTILHIMGINKPEEMTGKSLLTKLI